MATVTYEDLCVDNLITFTMAPLMDNFRTIDSFMKSFGAFQRKLIDVEKGQKATAHDLANFKMSTINNFSTMNEVLDSRGNISKGNNRALEQEVVEIKKTVKELKLFVADSTRELNSGMEAKEKETQDVYKKYDAKIAELYTYHESSKFKIESLENEVYSIKNRFTPRSQSEGIRQSLAQLREEVVSTKAEMNRVTELLSNLGVEQFRLILDRIDREVKQQLASMKGKFRLKTNVTDTLKLEEMLLNIINFSYESVGKKYASKSETKKALIYLEKKINAIISINAPTEEKGDREGLVTAKGLKCISCSKDLGEYEGKLDKYKVWSVFPTKEHSNKDRYSGFGTGFQNVVESVVAKKGGQLGYDEKGRMTTPFDLTREMQGSALNHSSSLSRPVQSKHSPVRPPAETNYMTLFGRNSNEPDLDIRAEYLQKQRGLLSTIKKIVEQQYETM